MSTIKNLSIKVIVNSLKEKCLKSDSAREFISNINIRGWTLGFLVLSTLVFHFSVQVNYNKNNLKRYQVDEFHTVYLGIESIVSGEVNNHRALEGSRWLVRAFYPGALIGMNRQMGGNVRNDSWGYPGHNYIRKHYKNPRFTNAPQEHPRMNDPNIRDFFFYLKLQNVIICFASVVLMVYWSWKSGYWISALLLASILGLNYYLMLQKSIFYIEAVYFTFLNLYVLLYLVLFNKKSISFFMLVLAAFFSAFLLSIKFSSLFFVILLFLTILYNERASGMERILKKIVLFSISFIFFFKHINIYAFKDKKSLDLSIHQFFSNFWQYATGTDTRHDFGFNFAGMLDVFSASLGYLVYLIPLIVILGFFIQSKVERLKYGGLVICLLLTVNTILDQNKFIARNFVPFLGVLVFITGVYVQGAVKYLEQRYERFPVSRLAYPLLSILILAGVIAERGGFSKFRTDLFPSSMRNLNNSLERIDNLDKRTVLLVDCSKKDFEGVDQSSFMELGSYPNVGDGNFTQVMDSVSKRLGTSDVVIVNRIFNNKQLTNYLLPKLYNRNEQFGSYFLFYNLKE